jgi:protein gp37
MSDAKKPQTPEPTGLAPCESQAERWSHRYGWTTHPWTVPHAATNVQCHAERLDQPRRWQKPRRIFVNSMSDLAHPQVPDAFLDACWAAMAAAPQHTFQILTKRPARLTAYLTDPATPVRIAQHAMREAPSFSWPLPHVWIGISAETHAWAAARLPWLARIPAAIRFCSAEPLLGPITFSAIPAAAALDWIIVGAESGPGARPMDDAWVRSIRDACIATSTAFFFKQRADAQGHKEPDPWLDGQRWQQWPTPPTRSSDPS